MNVVPMFERAPTSTWPELAPQVVQLLLARLRDADDAEVLDAQLRRGFRTLAADRYRPVACRLDPDDLDGLKLVALVVAVCFDAGEPVDMVYAALTADEQQRVLEYVAEFDGLLPADTGKVAHDVRPLRITRVGLALAAAASPVRMGPEPGIHRFLVNATEPDEAEIEIRLGGGPMEIRQVRGPQLEVTEERVALPWRDVLELEVDNGVDLAVWLGERLCLSSDDED